MCAYLPDFKSNEIMINAGTYNLIYIMTKMDDKTFVKRACIAIRKATLKRCSELLDAFHKNGLCEAVVKVLDEIGMAEFQKIEEKLLNLSQKEQTIRDIQVNCQCIMIQMCYMAKIISKFTKLNGMKYIEMLEKMKIIKSNRIAYLKTILQFCAENQSIRLSGPAIFFTKIIFEQLRVMYDANVTEKKPIDVQMENLCFHGLSNLSLNLQVHDVIWNVDNLRLIYEQVLLHFMKTIKIEKSDDIKMATKVVHINSHTYLSCIRIITNCLMTSEIRQRILTGKSDVNKKIVNFMFTFSDT